MKLTVKHNKWKACSMCGVRDNVVSVCWYPKGPKKRSAFYSCPECFNILYSRMFKKNSFDSIDTDIEGVDVFILNEQALTRLLVSTLSERQLSIWRGIAAAKGVLK